MPVAPPPPPPVIADSTTVTEEVEAEVELDGDSGHIVKVKLDQYVNLPVAKYV